MGWGGVLTSKPPQIVASFWYPSPPRGNTSFRGNKGKAGQPRNISVDTDFGAYKILASTISVDVIPGVAELIYF